MREFILGFVLVLFFNCSNNGKETRIVKFEEVLGQRETEALNSLVSDFETNLKKLYPDLSIDEGYRQYLDDMASDTIASYEKHKFQSNETNSKFHESGLWDEIYIRDPKRGLQLNNIGKYMRALYEVRDTDPLIDVYWDKRESGGMMQNILFVKGILNSNPNFNDYFHKRIVVVEFSF